MINKDRIVPITATDLLTLIYTEQAINESKFALATTNKVGCFDIQSNPADASAYLCAEPVKEMNISSALTTPIIFIPDYDFKGITVDGNPAALGTGSDDIIADGVSLYTAIYDGANSVLMILNHSAVGETGESIDATPQA